MNSFVAKTHIDFILLTGFTISQSFAKQNEIPRTK